MNYWKDIYYEIHLQATLHGVLTKMIIQIYIELIKQRIGKNEE